jgi:Ala-tRNA(Pro) deacylase
MPTTKVREFLDNHHVKYVVIGHSPAYTAQEIASLAHVSGKEMAKTVMVKVDGKMAMAVLPASYKVDFEGLKQGVGAKKVELAHEAEFRHLFPDCETGAMPPFGNLYDMPVYVAERLTEDEEIAFNSGTLTELFMMKYQDFEKLVKPKVIQFAMAGHAA